MKPAEYFALTPEWKGESVFIIAGGPSVSGQDLNLLRDKRTIVLNSSYLVYPNADFLIFGDVRWHNVHHQRPEFLRFPGRIIGASRQAKSPRVLNMRKVSPPPALAVKHNYGLVMKRTVLQAAINAAVLLGVKNIILLGADMARAADGRSHHHAPHKWKNKEGNLTWDKQMEFLREVAKQLAELRVNVVNTSAVSRIDWWPKMTLEEAVVNF